MLFDIIESYDKEKKDYLLDLWEKVINSLSTKYDSKKILSFLNKCGIIAIDDKERNVYIGVPNEFIESQVKKFFNKDLNLTIQQIYNPQFKIKIIVYTKFQSGRHQLQLNLKKILGISEEKAISIDTKTKDKLTNHFGILFDPKYKFENFVVGSNNQLAFSASKAISEKPGIVYNPLFIYGGVGLGKTHLLQAIGNFIIDNYKDKVVVYLPTTKLIDEIVESLRKNSLNNLLKKFDEVDVLILDDIQFLAEKERTQEIFHNIFNDFQMKKKQIILSSDRPPKELNLIEARLKSRFALGLTVDIKKPDFETRLAILKAKLKGNGEDLDTKYLDIIAKYVKDNVRELEGSLNIILTKKNLLGKEISENDIFESLETLGYDVKDNKIFEQSHIESAGEKNSRSKKTFAQIVEYVSNFYNISVYEIKGESRKKEVSLARQMLMCIAKEYFGWTLEKIGDYFGGKNHATVIYAINNFKKILNNKSQTYNDYQVILNEMGL